MTRDLLDALESRGVRLGYRLTVAAPKGAIDDDLKRLLAAAKPRIVEAMTRADRLGNPAVSYKDLLNCDADGFDWQRGVQLALDKAAGPGETFNLIGVDGSPVGDLSDLDREALSVDWPRPDPLTETAKLVAAEKARRAEIEATAEAVKRTRRKPGKQTGAPLLDDKRENETT